MKSKPTCKMAVTNSDWTSSAVRTLYGSRFNREMSCDEACLRLACSKRHLTCSQGGGNDETGRKANASTPQLGAQRLCHFNVAVSDQHVYAAPEPRHGVCAAPRAQDQDMAPDICHSFNDARAGKQWHHVTRVLIQLRGTTETLGES
jgi:hypothetical protein